MSLRAPLQLVSPAQPAEGLSPAESKRHIKGSKNRGDQVITLNRAFKTAGWFVGGAGTLFGLGCLGALSLVLYRNAPAIPVFNTIAPDGRIEEAVTVEDAPTRFTEVTSRQYLQTALEYCETYHFTTREVWAPRCGLFLNPAQRARFTRFYEGDDGWPRKLGSRGTLEAVNPTYTLMGKGQQNTEAWIVRFTRRETAPDGGRVCVPWQVTVQFQWRPELRMKPEDRRVNAAGFQSYTWEGQADPSGRPGTC